MSATATTTTSTTTTTTTAGAANALAASDLQVALSVGTVFLLLVAWFAGRRVADRLRGDVSEHVLNVALAVFLFVLVLAGSGALVVVWGATGEIATLLQNSTFGERPVILGTRALVTVGLFVLVYVATGVVHSAMDNFVKRREGISEHQTEVTFRVLQLVLYTAFVLLVLGLWNVNLSGLLIGAGFAGIVFGLAARQTLGALLAGFVLMFSRPFEIGDWVEIGDNEGIVTDITIVNTRIQTFDGEYVMLPNDVVGATDIVNKSRKGRLRHHVEVGVDYNTDVEHAVEVAAEAMKDVEEILTVPRPQAVLTEFGASAVTIDLRFWIDKPSARRKWRAHTAVIAAVHDAFREEGIKIPFPQRELSGRAETGGFRVAGGVPEGAVSAEAGDATNGDTTDETNADD
ncbi:mechanosensitive ion channel family protein [Halospeciosus flavus]|uniref:Mechanosensitive ion channel family protein n=1 Tax=Halospeciosus flavus TaxID=3032283 RepID=A0ABD5Z2N9_9EURY|nr:mechanosensitive ion channel family protein [Halospeciosus flavus]